MCKIRITNYLSRKSPRDEAIAQSQRTGAKEYTR